MYTILCAPQVMLLKNLDLQAEGDQKLVNGSCGVVIGYRPASYEQQVATHSQLAPPRCREAAAPTGRRRAQPGASNALSGQWERLPWHGRQLRTYQAVYRRVRACLIASMISYRVSLQYCNTMFIPSNVKGTAAQHVGRARQVQLEVYYTISSLSQKYASNPHWLVVS